MVLGIGDEKTPVLQPDALRPAEALVVRNEGLPGNEGRLSFVFRANAPGKGLRGPAVFFLEVASGIMGFALAWGRANRSVRLFYTIPFRRVNRRTATGALAGSS